MVNMNNSIIKHILLGGIITTLLTSCTGNYLDYNTNPYEVTKDEMGRDGYNLSAALIGMESYVVPVEEHLNLQNVFSVVLGVVILQIPKYGVTHFHTTILHKNG